MVVTGSNYDSLCVRAGGNASVIHRHVLPGGEVKARLGALWTKYSYIHGRWL